MRFVMNGAVAKTKTASICLTLKWTILCIVMDVTMSRESGGCHLHSHSGCMDGGFMKELTCIGAQSVNIYIPVSTLINVMRISARSAVRT